MNIRCVRFLSENSVIILLDIFNFFFFDRYGNPSCYINVINQLLRLSVDRI